MKSSLCLLALLLPLSSWGLVLHQKDSTLRPEGEKVYFETKDRIEVPDADIQAAPRYRMGRQDIPVSMADAIKLADTHFQKTLGMPFSEQSGYVDVKLSWTGSLADPVWWYHLTLRPYNKSALKDPERWDYQIAVLMNGRVYPATSTTKEVKDSPDSLRKSGIPFLKNQKRSELHPLEKELNRLGTLPDLQSDKTAGVYLHGNGSSAFVFYPDGTLFSLHTVREDFYKVDEEGRVFITHVQGANSDELDGYTYIGLIGKGQFIADQGDYQEVYLLKESLTGKEKKPEETKEPEQPKK